LKKGDKEGLLATLDVTLKAKEKITDEQKRIEALWWIAQIQAMAGQVEQAFRTAEQILTERNQLLSHIAANLIHIKDKDNFKKLLIPCAYSLNTAYKMCGCLAYMYPEKAESVAEVVKKFT
jgi:predicted TIM-barrel fold metal-dependent hydrolase